MSKPWTVPILLVASGTALIVQYLYLSRKQDSSNKDDSNKDVEYIIAQRRSIKSSTFVPDQRVPKDVLEKMLQAANWAPSHGKTEPWRFKIYQTEESIQKLAELDANVYKRIAESNNKFQQHKYDKRIKSKLQSSHVIAICMDRQASEQIPEYEELISVGIAVHNMHLVATKYNIGMVWTSALTGDKVTISTCQDQEMKQFLGLSEKQRCLGYLLLGIPGKDHPTGHRKDIKEKVTWVE